MKVMWIGGNHPRHLFFLNALQKEFEIVGAIIQKRENILPEPPEYVNQTDRQNFIKHFADRDNAEKKYFGTPSFPNCNILETSGDDINSENTAKFVNSVNPDVALIFGSGLIKEPVFSALPRHTINIHSGLSPRYRGSATLFWPFYFMEPNFAGSTFHYIVSEPDAGNVIHQCVPDLDLNDKIHDVGCKTVLKASMEAIQLLKLFEKEGKWTTYKQKGTGKNFLDRDFKPEHLRIIYNLFDNDMVKQYLEGKLKSKSPNLIRQF
jgi:methionyl-tRNA formyltransferase